MEGLIADLLNYIAFALDAVGVLLVLFGALVAIIRTVKTELSQDDRFKDYENTKRIFIQKIIFALDFFVASDMIKLVLSTGFQEILTVLITVIIRTILGWSLGREIRLHKE